MSLTTKTLAELSELLKSGAHTSREITEAFIAEIEAKDEGINAFVTTTFDLAREQADASDSRRDQGTVLSPLDGIPITLKDIVCTKEVRTTASSKMLENFVSPYDATIWTKLKEAGVVMLGKVNTDEFTMGASTETSAFGITKNPHDLERVAGGSSGGSAASVGGNMCAASIGTDTGGSIRQPAHFCGCTGLKVSYGRVSRYGTIPMASSLDTVGPLAKTPEDCAMMLQVLAGHDPKDATTPDVPVLDYTKGLNDSLKGLKIGVPKEYFIEGLDPEVAAVTNSAKEILRSLGADVVDISLPHSKYAVSVYYIVGPSEISANMARFDGIRFGTAQGDKNLQEIYEESREAGLGDEVKRRILIGTYALSAGYYDAYYRKAQKVRTLICQDFEKAFADVDVILAPVSPTPSFKVGENSGGDPMKMYLEDILTIPANLAGLPGLAVPMGKSKSNLPIGVQLIGKGFAEDEILKVGHQMYNAVQ